MLPNCKQQCQCQIDCQFIKYIKLITTTNFIKHHFENVCASLYEVTFHCFLYKPLEYYSVLLQTSVCLHHEYQFVKPIINWKTSRYFDICFSRFFNRSTSFGKFFDVFQWFSTLNERRNFNVFWTIKKTKKLWKIKRWKIDVDAGCRFEHFASQFNIMWPTTLNPSSFRSYKSLIPSLSWDYIT